MYKYNIFLTFEFYQKNIVGGVNNNTNKTATGSLQLVALYPPLHVVLSAPAGCNIVSDDVANHNKMNWVITT